LTSKGTRVISFYVGEMSALADVTYAELIVRPGRRMVY
jgi:hypothetical protein